MDLVTEYNFKAPDTMKTEDKLDGHVARTALEKYIQIVGQREDRFGDISAVTGGSYRLGIRM
jgi:hypothetical protein